MAYLYNDQKIKAKRRALRNNMPEAERKLWYYLRNKNLKGYKFRRQFSIDNFIVDFFCPKLKLAIEVDGDSHYIDSRATEYDKKREKLLTGQKVKILRFTNTDVDQNIDSVIEKILDYLP